MLFAFVLRKFQKPSQNHLQETSFSTVDASMVKYCEVWQETHFPDVHSTDMPLASKAEEHSETEERSQTSWSQSGVCFNEVILKKERKKLSPNVGKRFPWMVQVPFFLNSLDEKRCHWHGCGHAIEVSFVVVKPCFIPSPCLTGRPFKHRRRRRRKRKKKRTIPKLKCVRCTAQLSRVDENLQTTVFDIF